MLIYSAVVTYHTSFLLGDICLKYPHLDTFPKVQPVPAQGCQPYMCETHLLHLRKGLSDLKVVTKPRTVRR
jgi:hypothetical protein